MLVPSRILRGGPIAAEVSPACDIGMGAPSPMKIGTGVSDPRGGFFSGVGRSSLDDARLD